MATHFMDDVRLSSSQWAKRIGTGALIFALMLVAGQLGAAPATRVVAWGWNLYGQTNVPPDLTNAVAISGGYSHCLALRADGTVVAWGGNYYNQATVPEGLKDVQEIAAGGWHSAALKKNGTVVVWGNKNFGQLIIPEGLTKVVKIAAGGDETMALKADGTLVAWGDNRYGQSTVPAGLTDPADFAVGLLHATALKRDGTVVSWGLNAGGTDPLPSLTNGMRVAAGGWSNIGLRSNHTAVAWGNNNYGQTNLRPGLTNVTAVACGVYYTMVLNDGAVFVQGLPDYGVTNIPPGLTNIVAIAAGGHHCMVLEASPPTITPGPIGLSAGLGTNLVLTANVEGLGPLFYQWQLNDADIPGATDSSFTIKNLRLSNRGQYRVIVRNAAGSVCGPETDLSVDCPVTVLQADSRSHGKIDLTWNAVSGQAYQIQYKDDWSQTNWFNLGETVSATNSTPDVADPVSATPARFYRVILLP